MNLWLDDIRPAPVGWVWAKTYAQAVDCLITGRVEHCSLDHDLGENRRTGYDVVCWMEANDCWPLVSIAIHSMNPVGKANMLRAMERNGK